jgi:hypothetical protein
MSDLELDKICQRKSTGQKVKLIQEWLCLHDIPVAIDGDFGPATEESVKNFQTREALPTNGVVDPDTFACLIRPMTAALAPISPDDKSLGKMTVAYAKQHLEQHPREAGGQNRGPWVRLYMDGKEKEPWCTGFAWFVLNQACEALNVPVPLKPKFPRWSDSLVDEAKKRGIFVAESDINSCGQIAPGSLFVLRKSDGTNHTGIVVLAKSDKPVTIEGNAGPEDSDPSCEVCQRDNRGYARMDFIVFE